MGYTKRFLDAKTFEWQPGTCSSGCGRVGFVHVFRRLCRPCDDAFHADYAEHLHLSGTCSSCHSPGSIRATSGLCPVCEDRKDPRDEKGV